MFKWAYLIEADDRLRRLEKSAKVSNSIDAIKHYIQELARSHGEGAALQSLLNEFSILPGVEVDVWFTEEDYYLIKAMLEYPSQEEWVIQQLEAGNMYAWCLAHVNISWAGVVGDTNLGAISATGYKDAMDVVNYHGLYSEAVNYLISKIHNKDPWKRVVISSAHRKYVRDFLSGTENKDWVRF
jgi:hypothetical protein